MFKMIINFVFLLIVFAGGSKHSNYNWNLLIESIQNEQVSLLNLPVTYYSQGQMSAETAETHYFVLRQCFESTANLPYVKLNIIAPDNPLLNTTEGFVVMELSNTKDVWNASTIIYTNYIWDVKKPTIYNTIIWKFANGPKDIYGRFRAYQRMLPITLLASYYDNEQEIFGRYTENVIRPSKRTEEYNELHQYVKTITTYSVNNGDRVVFSFALCSLEYPYDADYTLTATVASDLASPLAAFDFVMCPINEFPDPEDCTLTNLDVPVNQDAAALVSLSISHRLGQRDLTQGVYLAIYGEGGNVDKINKFQVQVQAESDQI